MWQQMRLAAEARSCADADASLSPRYWRFFTWWTALGVLAFIAFLCIFWLLVTEA